MLLKNPANVKRIDGDLEWVKRKSARISGS